MIKIPNQVGNDDRGMGMMIEMFGVTISRHSVLDTESKNLFLFFYSALAEHLNSVSRETLPNTTSRFHLAHRT